MDWKTFTNFDAALPMPEQITTALGGKGRYHGRLYMTAKDKADALQVLGNTDLVRNPHPRSIQPVPKGQQARVDGLRSSDYLTVGYDIVLVVTHKPDGTRVGWPPVFVFKGRSFGWSWEGRIRNGGRWEPLGEEDVKHRG